MHSDARRDTLKRLLRQTTVRRQADLVRLLRSEGFDCTQSSISRDLRELGVAKFGDHYVIANEGSNAATPATDAFAALAGWVRDVLTAGPSLTVIKTNPGSAQSVAVAIDNANWPEVVGTLSGDDTLFVATAGAAEQQALVSRLRSLFFKA
jgi:transcriptional regulator of arginine metabolism